MIKRAGQFIQFLAVAAAGFAVRRLSLKTAQGLGRSLGRLLKKIDKKHTSLARQNMTMSFPEKTAAEIEAYMDGLFENIGMSLMEFLYIPALKGKKYEGFLKVEGKELLEQARAKGKGVIMIIPHFGNWELSGLIFPKIVPCMAVAFPQSNPFTDRLINKYRSLNGLRIVYTGDSVKEILRTLKKNEGVGLLADQDAAFDGVFVNIFGRLAGTKKGPAVLAMKTGAALLMTFMVRNSDGTHTAVVEKAIELDSTGDFEADVKANTQKWASMLESYVRKYPPLWFWVHNRWKSRPEDFKNKGDKTKGTEPGFCGRRTEDCGQTTDAQWPL